MKKNIVLFFDHFSNEHLGKDVFLIPYSLGKNSDASVTIFFIESKLNNDLPSIVRGVNLNAVSSQFGAIGAYLRFYNYLIFNAKKIDLFIRFHNTRETRFLIFLYKLFNPKGVSYLKLDIDPNEISVLHRKSNIVKRIACNLLNRFSLNPDIASCETMGAYKKYTESNLVDVREYGKLVFVPNGFDEDLLKSIGIKLKKFSEKSQLMITVGRIGTYQKNTEMFLSALAQVELCDWKIYFIGPIESSFMSYIEKFYMDYPKMLDNVKFLGLIEDKRELWEFYNSAKVFVLTSRWESYGLVLNEAKRFGDYLISTHVGASDDLIGNEKFGTYVEQDSVFDLARILRLIVSARINIDISNQDEAMRLSWDNVIKRIGV